MECGLLHRCLLNISLFAKLHIFKMTFPADPSMQGIQNMHQSVLVKSLKYSHILVRFRVHPDQFTVVYIIDPISIITYVLGLQRAGAFSVWQGLT